MNKLKYSFIALLCSTLLHLNTTAQHFQTVWSNNPYMPMSIFVDSARLDSVYLQVNDEIAVFDIDAVGNEICVGVVIITAEFLPDDEYIINASADDPTTPDQDGFIIGHTIIYRYWDNSEGVEINLFKKEYHPDMDNTYQELGTALVGLDGFYALIWTGDSDNNWHNSANWHLNNCIPDSSIRVLIPVWCTVSPVINTADASCKELKIAAGISLTISGNHMLKEYE